MKFGIESTYAFMNTYADNSYDSFDEAKKAFELLSSKVANHKHKMYEWIKIDEDTYRIGDLVMSHDIWGDVVQHKYF